MADIVIHESDMTFGPFSDSDVFRMEHSGVYVSGFRQQGIKVCEFVLQRNGKIYFVEAKKSCPNHNNAMTSEEKCKKYSEYIQDIPQKMRDSLNLYASILLNRNKAQDFPENMNVGDLRDFQIRFVLVVKNAQTEWLKHYQEKFQEELRREMRVWGIPSFVILNEDSARKKGLLVRDS